MPFQKLVFLIRDWDPADDIGFGFDAGKMLFDRKMEIRLGQTQEMLRIRKNIRSCFSPIECFLMHHPGLIMIEHSNFSGHLQDMRKEFIEDVQIFVSSILDPNNLIIKKIGDKEVTGKDLYDYINLYFEKFSSGDMPEVESITSLNSKSSVMFAKNKALSDYNSKMDNLIKDQTFIWKFRSKHINIMTESLDIFDHKTKLGGDEYIKFGRDELIQELDKQFQYYYQINSKNKKNCIEKLLFCCCPGLLK